MAITLTTMAIIFGTAASVLNDDGVKVPELGPVAGPIALVAANLFVVAFQRPGAGGVVLLGEMFPNRIQAAALVWPPPASGRTG